MNGQYSDTAVATLVVITHLLQTMLTVDCTCNNGKCPITQPIIKVSFHNNHTDIPTSCTNTFQEARNAPLWSAHPWLKSNIFKPEE